MTDLQELERICLRALELSPVERPDYLDRTCSTDQMRRDVESLLQVQSMADNLFSATQVPEDFGEAGPYQIVEKLGDGGMGVVFRAHQTEPVARDVALKIIRPGMASLQLISRFRRERQALAIMDHPNIARVHDAGATTRGLPYLVMELVSGCTIADYCDAEGLDRKQRVALVIPICQAIQHAHLKGIIHRDIKPSNVLVATYDGKPVPKVIDFGIAKAVEGAAHDAEGATRAGVMVGTFEYMSPEQAEPGLKDVDTRTDIYSLGALLYRLITGRVPLQGLNLENCTYNEILRRIREELPPPAGAGELDWVLNKALEKDRERRYQTADALALDLRRYVEGEPVDAAPPSTAYRVRKFAAKFKYSIAAGAAGLVLLFAALGWMIFALRQQTRANANAVALRDVVRKVLIERPQQLALEPGRTLLRAQIMRDAEGALQALSADTRDDTELEMDLAKAYLLVAGSKGEYTTTGSEGDFSSAIPYYRKGIELYRKVSAKRPDDVNLRKGLLSSIIALGFLQRRMGRLDEAEQSAREVLRTAELVPLGMREKVETRIYLAAAYKELGNIQASRGKEEEALAMHRKALASFRDGLPPEVLKNPLRRDAYAAFEGEAAISAWMFEGWSPEVEAGVRRALALVESCAMPYCKVRHAELLGVLGKMEWAVGKHASAIADLRASVESFEAILAEDAANSVVSRSLQEPRGYLAVALAQTSSPVEALALARKNLASDHDIVSPGADRERALVNRIQMAAVLNAASQPEQAAKDLRDALNASSEWAPKDLRWSAMFVLSQALEKRQKPGEAVSLQKEALRLARENASPAISNRTMLALAVRDYAATISRSRDATAQERADALSALEGCCQLDERYGVQAGAMIEWPPKAAELDAIRKLLQR